MVLRWITGLPDQTEQLWEQLPLYLLTVEDHVLIELM